MATLVREHVLGCVVELGGGWWMADGGRNGELSRRALAVQHSGRLAQRVLWARASARALGESEWWWWCGKCSGAGEVSQNTGKSGPQRRLQESETMGRAGGRVGGIALGRERV